MNVDAILTIIILALLAVNYGLTNRLMRQSGQSGMSATELLKKAEKMILDGGKNEVPKKPHGRFGLEKSVGSVPLEMPVAENYGKVSLRIEDWKETKK